MKKIKLSVSTIPTNSKPEGGTTKQIMRSFEQRECTITEIAELVSSPNGYTFASALHLGHTPLSGNWISQQILVLDFDGGMTLQSILNKFNEYGLDPNIVYESYSSTPDNPRYRVLYILNSPVTDWKTIKLYNEVLEYLFPSADKSVFRKGGILYAGQRVVHLNENINSDYKWNSVVGPIICMFKKNHSHKTLNQLECNDVEASESNVPDKYKVALRILSNRHINFVILASRVQIFRDFINGGWLFHNQLFGIASALHWMKGGEKLYRMIIQQAIQNGVPYSDDKIHIIEYVKKKEYYPQQLDVFSPYQECYKNLCTAVMSKSTYTPPLRISTPELLTVEECESKFSTAMQEILESDDTNIHIVCVPTGLGKTTYLQHNMRHGIIAFPTHRLKEEFANGLDCAYRMTMAEPAFKSPNVIRLINGAKDAQKYRTIQDIIELVASGELEALEEDVQLAKDYLNNNRNLLADGKLLLTTHAKIRYTRQLEAPVIVFDEDPISVYYPIGACSLSGFNNFLSSYHYVNILGRWIYALAQSESTGVRVTPKLSINPGVIRSYITQKGLPIDFLSLILSSCYYIDKENDKIHFIVANSFPECKVVILSATPFVELYQRLCPGRVVVYDYSNVRHEGKVIQYPRYSMTRGDFTSERIDIILAQMNYANIPVITFQNQKSKFPISMQSDMHFYNLRGYNEYDGCEIAVIGTPHPPRQVILLYAALLGYGLDISLDFGKREVTYKYFRFSISTYSDINLQRLHLQLIEFELIQAVGRARLLRQDSQVHLFGDFPLDISEFHDYDIIE